MTDTMQQFGPAYNVTGNGLAKYRKQAKAGLAALSRNERHAYGQAVEDAILAMQRREFLRNAVEPEQRCHCASGTWHSDGEAIGQAVRDQQNRALLSWPARCRAGRTPHDWQTMYAEAMPKGFVPSWERDDVREAA
jgi:hypothetical protein